MDKSTIDLLLLIGPYITPAFLTQAIKKSFCIRQRWIPLIPFFCSWALVALRELGQGTPLADGLIWRIIYDGVIGGAISIALFNLYHKTILNK